MSLCKMSDILPDFKQIFHKSPLCQISSKFSQRAPRRYFRTDSQTNGWTITTKLIGAFRVYANAFNNDYI